MTETSLETTQALLDVARAGHPIGSASAAGQLMLALGVETDHVSLTITDPQMTYQDWELGGKMLGLYASAAQWWLGDWMEAGETLFGQEAAQASDTADTRYDLEQRVTGLDPGYLANIRSVCGRVQRAQRRGELSFSHHQEVAPFEPAAQAEWLQKAVENSWNRNQLREAIRASRQIEDGQGGGGGGGGGSTIRERIEQVALDIYRSAEPGDPGFRRIPDELVHRLGAALGEE
jgi:hypothetical protein